MRLLPRFSVIALVLAVPLVPVASGADIPSDWAYRAVKRPDMPRISDQNLIANPIDAYLLDKLAAKKLAFALPADRRTLIRRVYFDLIGLPPKPEEIETFIADESPV